MRQRDFPGSSSHINYHDTSSVIRPGPPPTVPMTHRFASMEASGNTPNSNKGTSDLRTSTAASKAPNTDDSAMSSHTTNDYTGGAPVLTLPVEQTTEVLGGPVIDAPTSTQCFADDTPTVSAKPSYRCQITDCADPYLREMRSPARIDVPTQSKALCQGPRGRTTLSTEAKSEEKVQGSGGRAGACAGAGQVLHGANLHGSANHMFY
jgi:hypothetical protein